MDWQRWLAPFSVLVFVMVGVLEMRQPHTPLQLPTTRRWTFNFFLWVFSTVIAPFVLRVTALGLAARSNGSFPFLPFFLITDFASWLSHYAMHHVGPMWIFHSAHHSDPDMDASTGFRFHPVEGLWDQALFVALVYVLRPSFEAVIVYLYIAAALNFFVHANLRLPAWLDAALGWVIVTPGLHRHHHSIEYASQNSNYGINLSIWDRIFRTLRTPAPPRALGVTSLSPEETMHPLRTLFTLPMREWKNL